jgi:hypothetical protein
MELTVEQITYGPDNHFFGYIGHASTIPWNGRGRYILCLRTTHQDHMPGPGEAADVCLIDTENGYAVEKIDETCGWNPQQGTMFFWNPDNADSQFFFNDRDAETGRVFTVRFDIERRQRVKEYRYDDVAFGNSGVARTGRYILGINYARMARLRLVTGYRGATDWTDGVDHPEDDGIFRVNIESGEKELIVSFAQMRDALVAGGATDVSPLFINHTLWNRDGDRIYFYSRGGWDGNPGVKINNPFTVDPDGRNLTEQKTFIGGHPEWGQGHRMFGGVEDRLAILDTDTQEIVGQIADPSIIERPGGDSALSPDGSMVVTGYGVEGHNRWVVYQLVDGAWARTPDYDQRPYVSGDLRSDPAPLWNRDGTQILFPSMTSDGSRQLHLIHIQN